MKLICKQTGGTIEAEGQLAEKLVASGSFEKAAAKKAPAKKAAAAKE